MVLAHELGHGVHQVLAAPNGALMAPTPLTLAETASVFGEMLTFKRLLATVDSEGEAALMDAIQAMKRARATIVIVSHKTAMLAAVDKVLVLEAGRVLAFGGRVEVLSRLMGGPKIAAVAASATTVR